MYRILIKYPNEKFNGSLWQLYGTSSSTTGSTATFTPYETDNIAELEATVLALDKEIGSENIMVVKELSTEYVVDITVEDVENEEVTP